MVIKKRGHIELWFFKRNRFSICITSTIFILLLTPHGNDRIYYYLFEKEIFFVFFLFII